MVIMEISGSSSFSIPAPIMVEHLNSDIQELEQKLAQDPPNRSAIASHIVFLYDDSGKDPSFSSSEKRILTKAAQAALDPSLLTLLQRRSLLDIAIALVRNYKSDINTVAVSVCRPSPSIQGVRDEAIQVLKSELELWGLLREQAVDSNQAWFKRLCEKCPTALALQNLPWSQVEGYMLPKVNDGSSTDADDASTEVASSGGEEAVRKIWSQRSTLRDSIVRYGLPPSLAEKLESEGFTEVDKLTASKVESLIARNMSNSDKSKIRQLWQQESSEGLREQEKKMQRIADHRKHADEALRLSTELNAAMLKEEAAKASAAGRKLTEVMEKLKVSDWKWSEEKLSQPADLIKDLDGVQSSLQHVLSELPNVTPGRYQRDEEVIERASAGLALYGFSFGVSAPSCGLGMKPSRPLLRQPEFCPLTSPAYGNLIVDESFSSVEAASNFRSAVSASGKSFAAALKISGYGFGVEGSHVEARENSTTNQSTKRFQTNSAAHITYALLPVKSFRIPKSQMRLSVEAGDDARTVTNSQQARKFLERFGSHVSDGIHHLGGIFWKIVEMRLTQSAESSEFEEVLSSQRQSGLGAGGGAFGFGASLSVRRGSFCAKKNESGAENVQHQYEITTRIQTNGPNVTNHGLFAELLATNNQSWFIIDRAGTESLISVWEILRTYGSPELDQAAELIRSAWLQGAEAFAHIVDVQREIRRVRIEDWTNVHVNDLKALPELGLRVITAEDAAAAATDLLSTFCNADISQLSERGLTNRVAGVFKEIFDYDHKYSLDLFIKSMQGSELPRFLLKLATWRDQRQVRSVLQFLNSIFDPATLQRLDHADPPVALPSELIGAMKKATSSDAAFETVKDSTQIWHAPKVGIKELVPLLERLIRSFQTERLPNMSLLNERVARVLLVNLKQHLPSSAITEEMLLVVKHLGWTEDGFLSDITFDAMGALTMELREILSPSDTISSQAAPDIDGVTPVMGSLQVHMAMGKTSFVPQVQDGMPYSEWLVDRRTPDPAEELHRYLMFLLKHRLEFPVKSRTGDRALTPSNKTSGFSLRLGKKEPAAVPSTAGGDSVPSGSIFPLHLASQKLTASMDITARAELFRLLLDRRFLIPFITPVESQSFHCETAALALVQTVIGEDQEKRQVIDSLATNQTCLRVAIISERSLGQQATQQWVKGLFQVNSLLCVDLENGFKGAACFSDNPMAELGWGFVGQNVPVMILHVVGVYKGLRYFIKEFADVILADVGPYSSGLHSSSFFADKPVIEWASADPGKEDEEQGKWITLRCNQADSIGKIHSFLLDDARTMFEEYGNNQDSSLSFREHLTSSKFKVPYLIHMDTYGVNFLDVHAVVSKFDVARVRSEEFKLQQSFREEGLLQISLSREKLDYQRHMIQKQIGKIQKNRKMDSAQVERHQLLQQFVGILKQPSPSNRVIAVRQIEKVLAESSNKALAPLRESERRARILWRNSQKELDARDWGRAVEKLNSSNVNVEHLWRELSQLYATDPRRFADYPALAAQHLIDGFSLELMDGDAAMINVKWVMALMESLQEALQKKYSSSSGSTRCRLLVLSIVGPQSSGKSTLLNVMFGIQLRTSVSQTTRGVNIQLLPCHGRGNYDFVLLMDTEGLRAPENIGLEDSVWRDNRMATFAILPADATIILTLGESTTEINKVLPIVLSAYLDSELAQNTGGYLSPKLFFVFNQIDLSQANKMETIVDKLLEQLQENARIVEQTRVGVSEAEGIRSKRHVDTSSSFSTRYFNDFKYDVTDEKKNDVRIFGRIKHGDFPPGDIPNPEFGRRVLELREHIHRRVCHTGWKPKDLVEFGRHLELVWKCVLTSNFQFDFEDALQRMNFDVMGRSFTDIVHSLSVVYGEKFEEVCRKVNTEKDKIEEKDRVRVFDECLPQYNTSLQIATQEDINQLDCKIDELFAEQRYSKWRSEFEEKWNRQKGDQAIHWKRMLTEQVTNVFMYDTYVEIYKQRMRKETQKKFGNGKFRNYTEEEKDVLFQQMFQRLKEEAAQEHPPMATRVERNVHEIFRSSSSLPWTSNVEQREVLRSVWQTATDFLATAIQKVFIGSGNDRKRETLVEDIMGMVRARLTTVKKYSGDVVLDSLLLVARELKAAEQEARVSLSPKQKQATYDILLAILVKELRSIQETWDEQNSTSVRFAACEVDMRSYFNNLGQGLHAQELLVKMLQEHFTRNVMEGFEQEMAAVVGMRLRQARWVGNPQVMQAYIDKDLLRMMVDCNDVSSMLWAIKHSVEHFGDVIATLVQAQASQMVVTKYDNFQQILKRGLVTAATKASGAQSGRAELFLTALKKELRDCLTSTDNCLVDNLPVYDTNYDCDGQPTCIFTTDIPSIPSSIISCIPGHHVRGGSDSLVKSIIEYMRTRAYGAHNGISPRCGAPCPICRCACIKAVGHEGDADEKLHDTYHQPIGLTGWHDKNSNQLDRRSCPASVEEGRTFLHDGEYKPFQKFAQVFPSWAGPVVRRPLALREYIFRNYQEELVRLHPGTVACLDIPESYNHELSSIRAEIEGTIAEG